MERIRVVGRSEQPPYMKRKQRTRPQQLMRMKMKIMAAMKMWGARWS